VEIILLDEIEIGGFALQPGWRWSKDVAPIVPTRSCQARLAGSDGRWWPLESKPKWET
jgi:hypothetical protein